MRVSSLVSALLLAPAASAVLGAQHAAHHSSGTAATATQPGVIPVAAVMSAPFASGLVGSPGGRFAWAVAQRGAHSIYIGDAATAAATRVAHWPADDGQDLTELSLSRDGRVVAFVRGQPFNRIRENPNPTSDPAGAEQAVWVSVNGTPRKVGWGWAPRLSPDGRQVVFQRDSLLMIADVGVAGAAGARASIRPLFRARGVNQDPQWSPDGTRIAFTSNRGTHAFVGVYHVASRAITWIAPGIDRDGNPRWSPDGNQLLFTRTTAGGAIGVSLMAPAGATFAFHLADPVAGTARELWRSERGGRLGAPGMEQTLAWAGDRIVFSAELDGWHHLHVLDAGATAPRALTRGRCEVDGAAVLAAAGVAYASTNCVDKDTADVDRKHLWKLDLAGQIQPALITAGHHIEFAPVVAGARVAFLESEPHLPAKARLLAADGQRRVDVTGGPVVPASYPAHDALVMPRQVVFNSADGTPIHGQLFVPPNAAQSPGGAKRPAVIFMHGGPVRQMVLGFAPRGYYSNAYAMNQHLASKGYVVLSVNYRGGIGYGRAFREPPALGARGAIEYEDIVAGAKFLQGHAAVDGAKIGLWGGSYGGYLTALGMGRNPELFKAGVDLHGVHDWFAHYRQMNRPVNVPPGAAGDSITRLARLSSPVCCVDKIAGPLLLVHGDDDRNVPFEQTTSFVELLRRHGKPHELLVLPDEVHGFLRHASWVRVFEASSDFLDRKLAGVAATAAR